MQRGASPDARPLLTFWVVVFLVVVGLGVLAVGVPLVIAARSGALGIPRSDDWSYLLVQFRFAETGHIQLNNWVSMTLVGQIVLGTPVAAVTGRSIIAMQWFTALVGLVGLVAVAAMGRRLLRPAWWGVFVAAMIAVGPLWGPLAASFMTDVPSFTFGMLSLAAGVAGLRREPMSLVAIAVALVLGFVAFSIRQYGIVPATATVITASWVLIARRDWRRLRLVLLLAVVLAVFTGVLFLWWRALPGSLALSPSVPTFRSARTAAIKGSNLLRLVGLLVSPALVLAGPRVLVGRAWRASSRLTILVAVVAGGVLAGVYRHVPERPFVGDHIARDGVSSHYVLAGNRPDVVPRAVFDVMVVVGSIAAVLLVVALVPFLVDAWERVRARRLTPSNPAVALVGLTTVGYVGAYALAALAGLPLFDQHLPAGEFLPAQFPWSRRRNGREFQSMPPDFRARNKRNANVSLSLYFVSHLFSLINCFR